MPLQSVVPFCAYVTSSQSERGPSYESVYIGSTWCLIQTAGTLDKFPSYDIGVRQVSLLGFLDQDTVIASRGQHYTEVLN